MQPEHAEWKPRVDELVENLHDILTTDSRSAAEQAAAAWALRDGAETAFGSDIWLDAEDLEVVCAGDSAPAVHARAWHLRATAPGGALKGRQELARLVEAANGSRVDAIAPLLAPWQLHEALGRQCESAQAPRAALVETLIRWIPVRPTKRRGNRQLRDYATPPGAAATRQTLAAAAAGIRICEGGFRVRRIGAGPSLAAAAATAGATAQDREHVADAARRIVVTALRAACDAGRPIEDADARDADAKLAAAVETNPSIWTSVPLCPLRMQWTDEAAPEEVIGVQPHPGMHGDPYAAADPAAAAVLARWSKAETDPWLVRRACEHGAAAAVLSRNLPAMRENERWDLLQVASGLFSHGGNRGWTCGDEALGAVETGTRRAVSAHRRMGKIGCYLVELHPGAQSASAGPHTVDR